MEIKNCSFTANYNRNVKLIRVVEKFKNINLHDKVIYSTYRTHPSWTIINDSFLYSQEDEDIMKKQYDIKIKKYKEIIILVVRPDGKILKIKINQFYNKRKAVKSKF